MNSRKLVKRPTYSSGDDMPGGKMLGNTLDSKPGLYSF